MSTDQDTAPHASYASHSSRRRQPSSALAVLTAREAGDRIQAAVRRLDGAIVAVSPERLQTIRLHIPVMVTSLLASSRSLAALQPALARLPEYDASVAANISDYAYALLEAHLRTIGATTAPGLASKLRRGIRLRRLFLATLTMLATREAFDPEAMRQLQSGRGHRDLAVSLLGCVRSLRALPDTVRGQLLVTEAELNEAVQLALELEEDIAARRHGPRGDGEDPTMRRRQAYTLTLEAWTQVRRGVQFVRQPYGDADVIAPSLFNSSARRRSRLAEREAGGTDGHEISEASQHDRTSDLVEDRTPGTSETAH